MDQVANLLELRHQVAARVGGSPAAPAPSKARIVTAFDQLAVVTRMPAASPWAAELHALMPPDFLEVIPHHRLIHLPRYLKALQTRIERASLQPDKEQARRLQLAPYLEALGRWRANTHLTPEAGLVLDEYRWMVEEFRVSLFAQELGTPVPVSPKRLDQLLARLAELAPAKIGATGPESRR
jgi:ATP-dependent helicase HrpA